MSKHIVSFIASFIAFLIGWQIAEKIGAPKRVDISQYKLKMTFDTINAHNGQLIRLTDCDSRLTCIIFNGAISCVNSSPNWSKSMIDVMEERCR